MVQPRNSSTISILMLLSRTKSQLSMNFGFIVTKFKGSETVLKGQ